MFECHVDGHSVRRTIGVSHGAFVTVYPPVTHLDAVRARAHLRAWAWSRASFMESHLVSLSDFCSSTLECQGPVAAPGPHRHAPAWFQEGAPCPPCTSPHCSRTPSPSANPARAGETPGPLAPRGYAFLSGSESSVTGCFSHEAPGLALRSRPGL